MASSGPRDNVGARKVSYPACSVPVMTADVTTLEELVELVAGFEPDDQACAGTTVAQLIAAVAAIDPARVPAGQVRGVVNVLEALYERVEARVSLNAAAGRGYGGGFADEDAPLGGVVAVAG